MKSEKEVKMMARFKMFLCCMIGAPCAVLSAPYRGAKSLLNVADRKTESVLEDLETRSEMSALLGIIQIASSMLAYTVAGIATVLTWLPGIVCEYVSDVLLLSQDSIMSRALFESDFGLEYDKHHTQAMCERMERAEQELDPVPRHLEEVEIDRVFDEHKQYVGQYKDGPQV